MKIAIGSDHAGFAYKEAIKAHLAKAGHTVRDFGTDSEASVDYPVFIRPVAEAVARGEFERGIVLGGSGNGEAMAANRVKGARCALCWDIKSAELSRQHNDANLLSLGQRMMPLATALAIVDVWLSTPFEGGRHVRRVEQLGGFLLAVAVAASAPALAGAAREEYEGFRAAIDPSDVPAHLALARWCAGRGPELEEERKGLLVHVLSVDPRRDEAYRELGYVLREGVWMSLPDARREEGWGVHEGRLRPPDTFRPARLDALARAVAAADAAELPAAEAALLAFAAPGDARILEKHLASRQAPLRRAAARALWRIGGHDAVVEAFLDPRAEHADDLRGALAEPPREAFVAAARGALAPILARKARAPEERLIAVVDLLDTCPGAPSAELLYRIAVEAPGAELRDEAGRALARRKDPAVTAAVLELLARGTALGRARAGRLAVHLDEKRAIPLLADSLEKTLRGRARAEEAAAVREQEGLLASGTTISVGRSPFGYNAFLGTGGADGAPNFRDVPPEIPALQDLTGQAFGEDVPAWRRWWEKSGKGGE